MSDKDRLDILKTNLQKKMVKTFTFLLRSNIMGLTDSYIISNLFNNVHILPKKPDFTLWMAKRWALLNKSSWVLTDHVLSVTAYYHQIQLISETLFCAANHCWPAVDSLSIIEEFWTTIQDS